MANFKRGEFSTNLQNKINGIYKPIIEYASHDKDLDVQLRRNEIHIYYLGGKILGIKSGNGSNAFIFDKFYFYTDKSRKEADFKKGVKNGNIEDVKLYEQLELQKNNLINNYLCSNPINAKGYFEKAKSCMHDWFVINNNVERSAQHEFSIVNKGFDSQSDYIVLDIEYAISRNDSYKYQGNSPFHGKNSPKVVPIYDMVTIRKSDGKLVILELKKGINALEGKSGMHDHIDSFENSIKRSRQSELDFVQDMKVLLEQKKKMNLISDSININNDSVDFMFVYQYLNQESKENEKKTVLSELKKKTKGIDISKYQVLFIEPNQFILK